MTHVHTFIDATGFQRQAAYASDCDQCGTCRRETYPHTISRPPARVCGNRVLAWAELTRRDGEYPGGIVLTVRDDGAEYVTWTAYTKDGGETWAAFQGDYRNDHATAWADFTRRCTRLATS